MADTGDIYMENQNNAEYNIIDILEGLSCVTMNDEH